jgi:DNA mismatch repair protein MutS
VAQRAGIPAAVIRHASRELSRLEAQGAPTPQLDLFAAAAGDEVVAADADAHDDAASNTALRSALADIDPDQLSPREALDLRYRLRNEYL